jgi:hypothetical protein
MQMTNTFRLLFGAILSLGFGVEGLNAADDPKPVQSAKPSASDPAHMAAMPSVAPLFLEGSGFSSVLHLVNQTTTALTAQVDLYSLDGRKVAGKAVKVAANGGTTVGIEEMLRASGVRRVDAGSIRVSGEESDGIISALALTHHGVTDTYFDEELAMPSMDGSTILRGVADSATGSPIVAISSLATTSQRVTVTCFVEQGRPITRILELSANQTVLERPCNASRRFGFLSAADVSSTEADEDKEGSDRRAIGVAISTDGMPGELAAYGITPHLQRRQLFFTSLNFTDPKMRHSSSVAYTGVPVGPSPLLAEGDYSPELALTNFGSKPATVTVVAATTIGGTPKKQTIASVSLSAGQTRTLKLDRLPDSPDLRTSIVVESSAPAGDLGTKLVSRGTWRLPAVEMIEREGVDGQNGGGHPWKTSNGVKSVLLLFNHDPKEQWFNLSIGNGSKPWMKRYKLASMETLALNVNDLVARQEKDDSGQKLSPNAAEGEVGWQADSTMVGGRVLQTDAVHGMARNFSCANFITECALRFLPGNLVLGFGGGPGDLRVVPEYNLNLLYPDRSCSCKRSTYANLGLNYSWASGNTGIAQIVSWAPNNPVSSWVGSGIGQTTGGVWVTQPSYGVTCQATEPVQAKPTLTLKINNDLKKYTVTRGGGSITIVGSVLLSGGTATIPAVVNISTPANSSGVNLAEGSVAQTITTSASGNGSGTWSFTVATAPTNSQSGTISYQIDLSTTGTAVIAGSPIAVDVTTVP